MTESPRPLRSPAGRQVRIPQQARSRRTRQRVLDAAVDCFEAQGFEATTTAMIAERAGIAVGTLYAYFHDKRDILLELLDRTTREIEGQVASFLDPAHWQGDDPRKSVRELIDVLFHTQKLRPGIQRILWARSFVDEDFHQAFEDVRRHLRQVVGRFAESLAEAGWLRPIDPGSAAYVIVNAVQWNAAHAFSHLEPDQVDAASAATAEMVIRFVFRDDAS